MLAACAAPDRGPAYDTRTLFRVALNDIATLYVDEVNLPDAVLGGLTNLYIIDPDFRIEWTEVRTKAFLDQTTLFDRPTPQANDREGWAGLIATALEQAPRKSEAIASVPEAELHWAIFSGILAQLDESSWYQPEQRLWQELPLGNGTGLKLQPVREGMQVMSVEPGALAYHAGLRPDDILVEADGILLSGKSLEYAFRRLTDGVSDKVQVKVLRPGTAELLSLTWSRARLATSSVKLHPGPGVLQICAALFSPARRDAQGAQRGAGPVPRPAGHRPAGRGSSTCGATTAAS